MAVIEDGPKAIASPVADACLTDLDPGDYVLMVEGGDDYTYRLGYALVYRRAVEYLESPGANGCVPWYVVETVGGAEPHIVVAPVRSFVARLHPTQTIKLRAAGWPTSFQGFADALAHP